jgi:signal transduction histidine kinase
MIKMVHGALEQVRLETVASQQHIFSLAEVIAEARDAAGLDAQARGCRLSVTEVNPRLAVKGNQDLLLGALANLLSNALKFTHTHTEVRLHAYEHGDGILIEVRDNCGGLPPGSVERMFAPFTQHSHDKTGLGLGLSIAQQNIAAEGGILSVTDLPGTGCIFTISLPRYSLEP